MKLEAKALSTSLKKHSRKLQFLMNAAALVSGVVVAVVVQAVVGALL